MTASGEVLNTVMRRIRELFGNRPDHASVETGAGEPEVELGPDERLHGQRPTMVYALDGFLGAGSAPRLAAAHLAEQPGELLFSLDVDEFYDYRARRPPMVFDRDHYT